MEFKGKLAGFLLSTLIAADVQATVWSGSTEPPIVIGALTAEDLEEIPAQTAILLDRLRREIHPRQAALEYYDRRGLIHAIKNGSIRYAVVDPVFFASIENTYNARAVAGLVLRQAVDADHMTAATVFVSAKSKPEIRSIRDAVGLSALFLDRAGAGGRFALRAELNSLRHDPDRFFSREEVTNGHPHVLVQRVIDNPGTVGVLPACEIETLAANGKANLQDIRVLSGKNGQGLSCFRSTELYPGWVLAVLPGVTIDEVRRLVYIALSTESTGNIQWSFAPSSFAKVHNALIDLHEGPYENTHDWVIIDVVLRYKKWFYGFLILIAAIVLHSILAARLVRIRTRDLRLSMELQQKMSDDIIKARENLEAIQRMHVVSQMSSILAHEIKQPLATIRNFATGLRLYAEEGAVENALLKETLDDIVSETGRAAQIVQRVRSYAKNQQTERLAIDLSRAYPKTQWNHSCQCS